MAGAPFPYPPELRRELPRVLEVLRGAVERLTAAQQHALAGLEVVSAAPAEVPLAAYAGPARQRDRGANADEMTWTQRYNRRSMAISKMTSIAQVTRSAAELCGIDLEEALSNRFDEDVDPRTVAVFRNGLFKRSVTSIDPARPRLEPIALRGDLAKSKVELRVGGQSQMQISFRRVIDTWDHLASFEAGLSSLLDANPREMMGALGAASLDEVEASVEALFFTGEAISAYKSEVERQVASAVLDQVLASRGAAFTGSRAADDARSGLTASVRSALRVVARDDDEDIDSHVRALYASADREVSDALAADRAQYSEPPGRSLR